MFRQEIAVSLERKIRYCLLALGVAFLVWGVFIAVEYTFRMNSDRGWGEGLLLYDLGFIGLGVAIELLGLGLIVLGRK